MSEKSCAVRSVCVENVVCRRAETVERDERAGRYARELRNERVVGGAIDDLPP
jgi:hypothetical protein